MWGRGRGKHAKSEERKREIAGRRGGVSSERIERGVGQNGGVMRKMEVERRGGAAAF